MKAALLVFIGGGLGSVLRYLIGRQFVNVSSSLFPLGTLTVNVLGSFLIGIILGELLKNHSSNASLYLLFATGFCGGFTTFSAFAFENFELLKSGNTSGFLLYSFGSLLLGTLAVFGGIWLSKFFA
ncbi:fluoride efflux transporter CrcB [Patiriisocius sp. Uisw_017]|jgi:CrcB protein|uniref:fluoride efflux transporter CrcB n=1 Tax=Patiriisocius sp. Uisw_017 TaxID=3230968 RepID=UPI0039EA2841